jgi:hypothetical protein
MLPLAVASGKCGIEMSALPVQGAKLAKAVGPDNDVFRYDA